MRNALYKDPAQNCLMIKRAVYSGSSLQVQVQIYIDVSYMIQNSGPVNRSTLGAKRETMENDLETSHVGALTSLRKNFTAEMGESDVFK